MPNPIHDRVEVPGGAPVAELRAPLVTFFLQIPFTHGREAQSLQRCAGSSSDVNIKMGAAPRDSVRIGRCVSQITSFGG